MKLWITKSSFTGGHSFWGTKPKLVPSFGPNSSMDVYYEGTDRLTGDVYNLEVLFPKLMIPQQSGCKQIEITETEHGYTIEAVEDESERYRPSTEETS